MTEVTVVTVVTVVTEVTVVTVVAVVTVVTVVTEVKLFCPSSKNSSLFMKLEKVLENALNTEIYTKETQTEILVSNTA